MGGRSQRNLGVLIPRTGGTREPRMDGTVLHPPLSCPAANFLLTVCTQSEPLLKPRGLFPGHF